MTYRKRILLIDDVPSEHRVLEGFPNAEYFTRSAYSGKDGLKIAREWRPDVILLDYSMPEMDGPAVCRALHEDISTKDLPILMFTSSREDLFTTSLKCADDYLEKSIDFGKLIAKIDAHSRRFRPYALDNEGSTLTITCRNQMPLSFRVNHGAARYNDAGKTDLSAELHVQLADSFKYNSQVLYGNDPSATQDGWRKGVKLAGWDLYQKMFRSFPDLLGEYSSLKRLLPRQQYLHVRMECEPPLLAVPLEFIFDADPVTGGDFLSTRHPFARTLIMPHVCRPSVSRNWLNELRSAQNRDNSQAGTLRVLLLASNTPPQIDAVDQEIEQLAEVIPSLFANVGINAEVTSVPTNDASLETVRELLHQCAFHIIHYAGHSDFNPQQPERSAMYFWRRSNMQGTAEPLSTQTLRDLLEESSCRFIFFSSCSAAACDTSRASRNDNFRGLVDAALSAKVPMVLGYRWPASDTGAPTLAAQFYAALAREGEIDVALMKARRELRRETPEDPSWLSPILVSQ